MTTEDDLSVLVEELPLIKREVAGPNEIWRLCVVKECSKEDMRFTREVNLMVVDFNML